MATRKRTNSKSQPPALVQAYSLVSRAEEARTSGHWEDAVDMYNQASELFLIATNHTSDIETIKQLQLLSQAQSSKAIEIQRQLRRFSDPNKASRTDPIPVPGRTYSTSSASPPNISDAGSTPPTINASPSSMSPSAQIPNYVNAPTGSNKTTPNSSYSSSSNILQQPQIPQIPQEPPSSNAQFVNNQGRTGESFLMGSQNYFLGQAPSAANSVNEILLYQPKPGQPGYQGSFNDTATIPVQNSELRINPSNYSNNNSPNSSTVTNRGLGMGMESYMGNQIHPQQQVQYQNLTSPRNARGGFDSSDAVTEIPLNDSTPNWEGSDNPLMNLLPNVDLNNIWTWMEKMLEILPLKPIANMANFANGQNNVPQGQQNHSNAAPASLLNSFYIVPSSQGNPNMVRVSSPPPANTPKRTSLTMTDEQAQTAVKSVQLEEENKQLKDMIQKLQQENEQLRKVCDSGIQYYNDMLKQSIVQFKNEFQKRAKQQQMFNSVNLTPQTATYSQFLGSGKPPLMSQSQAVNFVHQGNTDKEYIQQLEQRIAELSQQLRLMNEKSIKQQRLIEKYEQRLQNLTEEQRIRRNMSDQSGVNHSIGSHPMSSSGMSIGGSLSDMGSVYTSVIDTNSSSSFANSGLRSNMQDTQYQSVMNPNDNEYSDLSSSILQTKDQFSNLKIHPQ